MRKFIVGIGAASVLALCAAASPAYAVTSLFVKATATDGDETKFYINSKDDTSTTLDGSIAKNTTVDDIDVTTIGTQSHTGNGYANIKGTDSGTDFLTSLTFTPNAASGATFDGMFADVQLDTTTHGPKTATVYLTVTGVDGVTSPLITFTGIKTNGDFHTVGFEAFNDTDLVKSVTLYVIKNADNPVWFKQVKQIEFSGVGGVGTEGGPGGVPEPATWIVMIAGFGMAGSLLRRQQRTLASVVS